MIMTIATSNRVLLLVTYLVYTSI